MTAVFQRVFLASKKKAAAHAVVQAVRTIMLELAGLDESDGLHYQHNVTVFARTEPMVSSASTTRAQRSVRGIADGSCCVAFASTSDFPGECALWTAGVMTRTQSAMLHVMKSKLDSLTEFRRYHVTGRVNIIHGAELRLGTLRRTDSPQITVILEVVATAPVPAALNSYFSRLRRRLVDQEVELSPVSTRDLRGSTRVIPSDPLCQLAMPYLAIVAQQLPELQRALGTGQRGGSAAAASSGTGIDDLPSGAAGQPAPSLGPPGVGAIPHGAALSGSTLAAGAGARAAPPYTVVDLVGDEHASTRAGAAAQQQQLPPPQLPQQQHYQQQQLQFHQHQQHQPPSQELVQQRQPYLQAAYDPRTHAGSARAPTYPPVSTGAGGQEHPQVPYYAAAAFQPAHHHAPGHPAGRPQLHAAMLAGDLPAPMLPR